MINIPKSKEGYVIQIQVHCSSSDVFAVWYVSPLRALVFLAFGLVCGAVVGTEREWGSGYGEGMACLNGFVCVPALRGLLVTCMKLLQVDLLGVDTAVETSSGSQTVIAYYSLSHFQNVFFLLTFV